MINEQAVSRNYTHGDLLHAIEAAVAKLGKTVDTLTIDDLAPVDEFHIGGRQATERFLTQLNFSPNDHWLDVGCGLGGDARYVANRFGARVSGIDLTPEYVETGKRLCQWVGLADQIALHQGSALAMPFADATFDGGYMVHVGMNIEDKTQLFAEIFRLLRPGATFGIYDIMRAGDDDLRYPVPWATVADIDRSVPPTHYHQALLAAGFELLAENDRSDFALDFFQAMQARTAANGGPPPLGLHVLMGQSTAPKVQNMIQNLAAGRIAPVEMIVRKAESIAT
ncbi:MAG TPA: class I SAM-dependent methyltransferase [Caldilineaceae bacterium]|nr:class I SAM-dependent methyltransferase [Caldilineaceae bacterium]